MTASEKKKKIEDEDQLPDEQSGKKKREKSLFREYFELIAETAIFVFFVMTYVVQAFQIPSVRWSRLCWSEIFYWSISSSMPGR